MAEWSLFSRDRDYELSGGLRLSAAKAVVRHLGVDTGIIETPFSEDAYARTEKGCGVVLQRDGRQEFSGLVASERAMGWDAETSQPTIKVQVLGDNVHIDDRLAFPDPTRAGDDQTTADYWRFTGPASSAMWAMINQQVGPAARPERRVTALYMGEDAGVGASRTWEVLFTSALEACASFSALSGADPGVRIRSTADGLRCDVYAPRQLAGDVKFSADLSNLHGFTYTETAPTLTYALVAGQGDLRNRMRRAATSARAEDLAWGRRIERYVDRRDEADAAKLAQAAADAVVEGAGSVNLACSLSDSQAATYGLHWGLGDRVTVYVGLPGRPKPVDVVDVVREIEFTVTSSGAETIRPAIGSHDAKAVRPTPTQASLARVGRALAGLITRK